jgi:hypothetical protein
MVFMTVENIREKGKSFTNRIGAFYEKNELPMSKIIGALVCVAATLIIDKKWKFENHSKVVNLFMAGATDKKMFEGIKVLNFFLSASTIINSIWDIAQNEK